MLFVVFFQRRAELLYVSIALCVVALVTDVLDGYVARRLKVASIHGRLWDSLGDKSFYAAVIIAFNAQGFLGELVSWGLIVRDIALYITRVLYIEKLPKIEKDSALDELARLLHVLDNRARAGPDVRRDTRPLIPHSPLHAGLRLRRARVRRREHNPFPQTPLNVFEMTGQSFTTPETTTAPGLIAKFTIADTFILCS